MRENRPAPTVVSALGDINSQTRAMKKHPGMGTFYNRVLLGIRKASYRRQGIQPRAKSIAREFIPFWSSDMMSLGMLLLPTLLLGLCVIPEQLDLKERSRTPSSIPREGLLPPLGASPGSWLGFQPPTPCLALPSVLSPCILVPCHFHLWVYGDSKYLQKMINDPFYFLASPSAKGLGQQPI